MSEILANSFEAEYARLSLADKFRSILKIFGTEIAKKNFIELCQEYYKLRVNSRTAIDHENYRKGPKVNYSTPQRASIHNRIMDTIQKLSLARNLNPLQQKVLLEMGDREHVAGMIRDYLSHEKWLDSDEDEFVNGNKSSPKDGESEVAFFHRMSKD